ncbi:saccharopine dehydrogenase family protein [Streptomyces boncukensis]|uniref:Saccharopine dehydrogenase n=1 Tax=Streptomyces boncukensis TaxID=2711219 RepID=A0A6G4X5A5_9ACTN|nr:saccharopine dehydrogenase NADP-binding domain-containing protein [Streptomyces boncukensis]NGO72050.1 saccharopine dehydrogenase [Streptomyces boncukensis]
MAEVTQEREFDVVLFGATGFTGALTAEYLVRHTPDDCRWAVAGRDRGRLEALRGRLAAIRPECAELPLLHADAADAASMRELAARARVVATTVGPYIRYGAPLVAACAAAGTDYVDLCGEPEFVDLMYLRYHFQARETGARLVHACGFDSVPYDLGTQFTVERLPEGEPLRVAAYVRVHAAFSGGTYASTLFSVARSDRAQRTARERRTADPRPAHRSVRTPLGRIGRTPAHTGLDAWAVPLPTIDPQIVGRSAAALERYGPRFSYSEYAALPNLPLTVGAVAGAGAVAAAVRLPAARRFLLTRRTAGEGPGAERRARSWFTVRFSGEGGGRRVLTEVSGGDPGYDETSKILAEAALCLASDPLPAASGQLTPAVAMGGALRERLVAADLGFRVLAESEVQEPEV